MIERLMQTPATLIVPGVAAEDRYGNTGPSFADPDRHDMLCQIAYSGGSERTAVAGIEVEQCQVFMPISPGERATASSQVELEDGTLIELIEPPRKPVRATTGRPTHVEARGRVTT